ncbi:stage II sporulation protein R [Effusibacillus pohliae]|uniref:stage II sporulation protein R n=1 Tax=Effusibacillus pohliae TaxID=232270 RepID=UPI000378D80E|nr:stage II sporulation protein R [Effusibacillus pohliae]
MRVRLVAGMAGMIFAGGLLNGWQAASPAKIAEAAQPIQAYAGAKAAVQGAENRLAAADRATGEIPADAVRLRIIANSDSPEDQALKRRIRDRIIDEVGKRLRGVASHDKARQVIQAEVPQLNAIAADVVKQAGASYPVRTDYGMVPFPTKIYGNKVYPAGEYEALRIVIGAGKGQNWWCVLFPPLCFVDLANGDAVQAKDMDTKPLATVQVPAGDRNAAQAVQVRLGILDLLTSLVIKIGEIVKSIFA